MFQEIDVLIEILVEDLKSILAEIDLCRKQAAHLRSLLQTAEIRLLEFQLSPGSITAYSKQARDIHASQDGGAAQSLLTEFTNG